MARPGSTLTLERTPSASQASSSTLPHCADGGCLLAFHVRHTEAAAEDQLGQVERHGEVGHHLGRLRERRRLEHVRADVAVHAHQFHRRRSARMIDGTQRIAIGQVEPELRVVLARGDELVRVRVNAWRDAQHHLGCGSDASSSEHVEPVEFIEGIDHDVAHLRLDRFAQLGARFVVAVQRACARRYAGRQRHVEFAAGGDVEQQPLVVGELRHRSAQERLGGIDHPFAPEGANRFTAAGAQVCLVVDEQRRAVLLGQGLDRHPAHFEPSVMADGRCVGEQPPRDRRHRATPNRIPHPFALQFWWPRPPKLQRKRSGRGIWRVTSAPGRRCRAVRERARACVP